MLVLDTPCDESNAVAARALRFNDVDGSTFCLTIMSCIIARELTLEDTYDGASYLNSRVNNGSVSFDRLTDNVETSFSDFLFNWTMLSLGTFASN
jgi:hypothetical protein